MFGNCRGGGEARCSSILGAFGTGEWWGERLKIPITWRILDRIMFRFFDGPSMAPSVCVDINFGEIDHGKGCFWQMGKGGNRCIVQSSRTPTLFTHLLELRAGEHTVCVRREVQQTIYSATWFWCHCVHIFFSSNVYLSKIIVLS
jgi:hypothetical protein